MFLDLGSFQVFGLAEDSIRPVLVQPLTNRSPTKTSKLLQIEFETNPLDKKSDYRIKVISQSVEIKYNAVRKTFNSEEIKFSFSAND